MVELVDTRDLKSLDQKWLCGFESRSRHQEPTMNYRLRDFKGYKH